MTKKNERIEHVKLVETMKKGEITGKKEIEKIIKKAIICRFGFIDGDEAYIAPTPFGYERNALYYHGSLTDRKAGLSKENSKVYFEITTEAEPVRVKPGGPCNWMMVYSRVVGTGRIHILEKDEDKSHGLRVIVNHYAEGELSFPKSKLDKTLVVKVNIESITGIKSEALG